MEKLNYIMEKGIKGVLVRANHKHRKEGTNKGKPSTEPKYLLICQFRT
jgi:hypothetical protein